MKSSRIVLLAKGGSLAGYSISCVTMASMAVAALALAVGVAGASPFSTPLDGFLAVWGLPLLFVSVAVLMWALRHGPRLALAFVGTGGVLNTVAMLLMVLSPSSSGTPGMPGMDSSTAQSPGAIPAFGIALLFWVGAALLILGYAWTWWAGRRKRMDAIREPSEGSGPPTELRVP